MQVHEPGASQPLPQWEERRLEANTRGFRRACEQAPLEVSRDHEVEG